MMPDTPQQMMLIEGDVTLFPEVAAPREELFLVLAFYRPGHYWKVHSGGYMNLEAAAKAAAQLAHGWTNRRIVKVACA